MKVALVFLLGCFLAAAVVPLVGGVDLVALKKQEEERRKNLAKSKIAVTDANVNSISAGGSKYGFVQMESDAAAAGETPVVSEAKDKKENEDLTRQPEFWRKQKDELEQRIAGLKTDIESAQLELNRLWSDFYIKSIATEQEAIRSQIAQKTDETEQKKVLLSESEAQLEGLYEKARKAGIPPGWLR